MSHQVKKIYILLMLVMLLLVSNVAFAQPPTFQESPAGTIDISVPKNAFFKQNADIELHFHVFNSTGYILTNVTTTCMIHIYNNSNNRHIVKDNLSFDEPTDFSYNLSASLESRLGMFPYIVECESDHEGGFVSTVFDISQSGELDVNNINMPLSIFIVLIFMAIIFIMIGSVLLRDNGREITPEQKNWVAVKKCVGVMMFFVSSFFITTIFFLLMEFTKGKAYHPFFQQMFYIFGIGVLIIGVSGFVILMILMLMFLMATLLQKVTKKG